MHDLELARLIHADREREIAHDRRVHAFRVGPEGDRDDAFVPPPADSAPTTLAGALRLMPEPAPRRLAGRALPAVAS